MHTLKVLLSGFALLGVCLCVGRLAASSRGMAIASLIFIPIWFVAAAVNFYIGVSRAGYSFNEELPVFLLAFLLPTLIALILYGKLSVD
jgi:hypothetical protein